MASLTAAGYEAYAINPLKAAHYRQRHSTSGAKCDAAYAHLLAEIVRIDRHNHQPIVGDSALAEGIKLAARAHQGLVWDRTRHMLRLRSALREFFPVALKSFSELDAPDALAVSRHPFHGCLKTGALYDGKTAWHTSTSKPLDFQKPRMPAAQR